MTLQSHEAIPIPAPPVVGVARSHGPMATHFSEGGAWSEIREVEGGGGWLYLSREGQQEITNNCGETPDDIVFLALFTLLCLTISTVNTILSCSCIFVFVLIDRFFPPK